MHYSALVNAREAARLTQVDLAARLKITQSHLSALERGEKNPSSDLLRRWAAELGYELVLQPTPQAA